jgi:hypothetical protein
MLNIKPSTSIALFLMAAALPILSACDPKYNWREVHGKDASFVVLLPDKPVSMSRPINLNGEPVTMTMTAAEVDGVNFAVGYVQVSDAKLAPAALNSMKTALVKNINGAIKHEQPPAAQSVAEGQQTNATDIEATGTRATNSGAEPLLLIGHFAVKGNRVYQVIVLGSEKAVPREEANTFLSSFRPD